MISNSSSCEQTFCVEPWGGRYVVPPGGALRVLIEASSEPVLAWDFRDDGPALEVHGPAGALATVYDGDNRVTAL